MDRICKRKADLSSACRHFIFWWKIILLTLALEMYVVTWLFMHMAATMPKRQNFAVERCKVSGIHQRIVCSIKIVVFCQYTVATAHGTCQEHNV